MGVPPTQACRLGTGETGKEIISRASIPDNQSTASSSNTTLMSGLYKSNTLSLHFIQINQHADFESLMDHVRSGDNEQDRWY
jgi:hypothetical protein